MERLAIRGGRCTIDDEAIRIDESPKIFVRRKYDEHPVLVEAFLLAWVSSLAGTVIFGAAMLAFDGYWNLFFDLMMASAAFSGLVAFTTFVVAMWWSLSIKRAQWAGEYPRNLSSDDVIPAESVESVAFDRYREYPVAFIEYRRDGEEVVRPVLFPNGADSEVERARTAFRSLNVPVDSVESTRTGAR